MHTNGLLNVFDPQLELCSKSSDRISKRSLQSRQVNAFTVIDSGEKSSAGKIAPSFPSRCEEVCEGCNDMSGQDSGIFSHLPAISAIADIPFPVYIVFDVATFFTIPKAGRSKSFSFKAPPIIDGFVESSDFEGLLLVIITVDQYVDFGLSVVTGCVKGGDRVSEDDVTSEENLCRRGVCACSGSCPLVKVSRKDGKMF